VEVTAVANYLLRAPDYVELLVSGSAEPMGPPRRSMQWLIDKAVTDGHAGIGHLHAPLSDVAEGQRDPGRGTCGFNISRPAGTVDAGRQVAKSLVLPVLARVDFVREFARRRGNEPGTYSGIPSSASFFVSAT
jgi:hypothetical protein